MRGKKKIIIKALSVMLAVVLTLTAAPLSGFVGLELPKWINTSLRAGATDTSVDCDGGSVTPVNEDYKIILNWGSSPNDLDSHISGTLPDGPSFHC